MPYSIAEASKMAGVPASTIRYYEKEGLLPRINRTSGCMRRFEDGDIEWLNFIVCFLKTGMPLASVKKIVELAQQGDDTIEERKKILRDHREELQKRQRELDEAMAAVEKKLKLYGECCCSAEQGEA